MYLCIYDSVGTIEMLELKKKKKNCMGISRKLVNVEIFEFIIFFFFERLKKPNRQTVWRVFAGQIV